MKIEVKWGKSSLTFESSDPTFIDKQPKVFQKFFTEVLEKEISVLLSMILTLLVVAITSQNASEIVLRSMINFVDKLTVETTEFLNLLTKIEIVDDQIGSVPVEPNLDVYKQAMDDLDLPDIDGFGPSPDGDGE